MENFGIWSILPPIISIVLALYTKDVFTSLLLGCFSAYTILAGGNLLLGASDTLFSFIKVFENNGNTIVVVATALIGALLVVTEKSGGVEGFVKFLTSKRSLIKSKKGAEIFSWILGVIIFNAGSVSALVAGTVSRPVTDAYKVSHEKLSYIVHSTTSPVCALLPLSSWGAYMISLLQSQGIENPTSVLIKSIPMNMYCVIAVLMVPTIVLLGKDYGPMLKAEKRTRETGLLDEPQEGMQAQQEAAANSEEVPATSPINLLAPIISMIAMIIAGLLITGNGNLLKGNGMTAILWGSVVALIVALALYRSQKIMTYKQFVDYVFKGAGDLLPIACILVFAWSLGGSVKQLGTGQYLATTLSGIITPTILPALIFIISCIISFATGSSWGTMAVMGPIGLPMALAYGVSIPLAFSAIVGGGIFGDHASPISDTTIMSCFTTRCRVIDHVKTQLPYALTAAIGTIIIYLVMGFVL